MFYHSCPVNIILRLDTRLVETLSAIFDGFHDALFAFFIELPTDFENDTQLIINNYKELIRIQDNDNRTMKLMSGAGGSVGSNGEGGIELAEQYEAKMAELKAANRRIQDLEQEVFDWKNQFLEKEKAVSEKEKAYEQLSNEFSEEKKRLEEEKKVLENEVSGMEEERANAAEELVRVQKDHDQALESMMIGLKKKEEQVSYLNGENASLEQTIQELKEQLQKNERTQSNRYIDLEDELGICQQELGATKNALQQSEKRYTTLSREYDIMEEELESAKKELAQLMTRPQSNPEADALRVELEHTRSIRVGLYACKGRGNVNEYMDEWMIDID